MAYNLVAAMLIVLLAVYYTDSVSSGVTNRKNVKGRTPPYRTHPERYFLIEKGQDDKEKVVLPCDVDGDPAIFQTRWTHNGAVKPYFAKCLMNRSLALDSFEIEDGRYTCESCNRFGCANSTVMVDVVEKILDSGMHNMSVMAGSSAFFSCRFENTALQMNLFTSPMFFKAGPIKSKQYLESIQPIAEGYTLFLENVSPEDSGWYTCAIYKDRTVKLSYKSAFLNVYEDPYELARRQRMNRCITVGSVTLCVVVVVGLILYRLIVKKIKNRSSENKGSSSHPGLNKNTIS